MIITKMKTAFQLLLRLLKKESPDSVQLFDSLYFFKKDPWNYSTSEYERKKYGETLEAISGKKYNRILEIGCAEGVFTEKLASMAESILGVDISQIAIDRAIEDNKYSNIEFQCVNIERTDLFGKFDLIICSEVLYYLDTPERISRMMDRLVSLLENRGQILLVNMRLLSEDESGHPPPIAGYPLVGAKTVHGVFQKSDRLKRVFENKRELYVISLFEKVNHSDSKYNF